MDASTTLMTFMVRTPPITRSVTLYGSWDNFSTPYPMSRDVRLGREHWSGCHSFENIICDGNLNGLDFPRNGGLKMGGTYWYYYKLDDEIEFHNSAEPATTRCPLLPGQLVNLLHVPFALSGSRKRDASVSSTSSERRTFDPEAKFTNPRPVPTPPKLIRLNTSPTLLQETKMDSSAQTGSVSAAPLMQSAGDYQLGPASSRIFHLPRKSSLGSLLKAASTKRNPTGLRQAFNPSESTKSTKQSQRFQDIINWLPEKPENPREQVTTLLVQQALPVEQSVKPPRGALLLRSHSDDVITLSSFREHRKQRSRSSSRDRSARTSILFDEAAPPDLHSRRGIEPGPLSALLEVNTPECTPVYGPMTGRRITLEALEGRNECSLPLEKRLPTLPNTPSSVYPPTIADNSPPRNTTDPECRFSATTIDTTCYLNSVIIDDERNGRFLDFNTAAAYSSPTSESIIDDGTGISTIAEEHDSASRPESSNAPDSAATSDTDEDPVRLRTLSSAMSSTTISSTASTSPPTSYHERDVLDTNRFTYATSIRSSAASYSQFLHYSLPEIENASEVTLKRYDSRDRALVEDDRTHTNHQASVFSHSESMQQLLDELSYLSAMIQQ